MNWSYVIETLSNVCYAALLDVYFDFRFQNQQNHLECTLRSLSDEGSCVELELLRRIAQRVQR